MKKVYYYIIPALFITGAVSFFLNQQYGLIKNQTTEFFKESTAARLIDHAKGLINPEDFDSQDIASQKQIFENFWKSVQSPEIVRIKIWDRNYKIIWSDLTGLIGQSFPNYEEVAEALDGEVAFEIVGDQQKAESISERQYTELSETYVPYADKDGKIAGVIEVYQPTIVLNREIQGNFSNTAMPIILSAIAGYLIIAVTLRFLLRKRP